MHTLLPQEPVIKTVWFGTFVRKLIPELLKRHPAEGRAQPTHFRDLKLPFTEGWCFGEAGEIEDVIDTSMAGGDSNYHYHDMEADDRIHLTAHGFRPAKVSEDGYLRSNKPVQFFFVQTVPLPESLKTLEDLALLQEKTPGCLVTEVDFDLAVVFEKLTQSQIQEALALGTLTGHEALQTPILQKLLQHAGEDEDVSPYFDGKLPIVPCNEWDEKTYSVDVANVRTVGSVRKSKLGAFKIEGLPLDVSFGSDVYSLWAPIENVWKGII